MLNEPRLGDLPFMLMTFIEGGQMPSRPVGARAAAPTGLLHDCSRAKNLGGYSHGLPEIGKIHFG